VDEYRPIAAFGDPADGCFDPLDMIGDVVPGVVITPSILRKRSPFLRPDNNKTQFSRPRHMTFLSRAKQMFGISAVARPKTAPRARYGRNLFSGLPIHNPGAAKTQGQASA
jgi:hypothetical protein